MNLGAVAPIEIPIMEGLYQSLHDGMVQGLESSPVLHTVSLSGHQTMGHWVVTGLRSDYGLGNVRTFWATLEWRP